MLLWLVVRDDEEDDDDDGWFIDFGMKSKERKTREHEK